MMRKQIEERLIKERSAQLVEKAYHELQEKAKAEKVVKQIYKQVTPTFAADVDSIWAEVDWFSRHVDVRVHFLRDMVRDGAVKPIKCAGTQNVAYVADTPTKSLPKLAFHKHREFLHGNAQSCFVFFASPHVSRTESSVEVTLTKPGPAVKQASILTPSLR